MAGFTGLTLTAYNGVDALLTELGDYSDGAYATTVYLAGILDQNTFKIYNPVAEGNNVVSGTTKVSDMLPTVALVTLAQVTDNYWAPVLSNNDVSYTATTSTGQVMIQLTPAAANVVEASSVQTVKVSANAIFLTASGSATF